MQGAGLPTLLTKGSFSFHPSAKIPADIDKYMENKTAIDIILEVLVRKVKQPQKYFNKINCNCIYFLEGRTGSGKSTLMIDRLFFKFIKDSTKHLLCTEPRVVLAESNVNDVIAHNKLFVLGHNIGFQTGAIKVIPKEISVNYCTTQILNERLIRILTAETKKRALKILSKFKIIVVDEVHTLDLPMISLIKNIFEVLTLYSNEYGCPLFIFTSATINTNQLNKYFFGTNKTLENPYIYGCVSGAVNFPIKEIYLTKSEIENLRRNSENDRLAAYKSYAEYFLRNYYRDLWNSQSFLNTEFGKIQCRDVLFFVPLVAAIEIIKSYLINRIKDRPVFAISKQTKREDLDVWRLQNKNKQRINIIGFARNYSSVSDELLSKSYEADVEVMENETKIFICTSIIETGKTIKALYLCFDTGFDTVSIHTPLTLEQNNKLKYLKQIPVNKIQVIQRRGRIGREAPGIFVHCYTQETFNKLQERDTPQTVNNSCLSALILDSLKNKKEGIQINVMNENIYLFPIPLDLLIVSIQDLIYSGFLTIYGENVNLRYSHEAGNTWITFVKFLYYIKKLSLFESLVLVYLNIKKLPSPITVMKFNLNNTFMNFEELVRLNSSITLDLIEGIQRARNHITRTKYFKDSPFVYIKDRTFPS